MQEATDTLKDELVTGLEGNNESNNFDRVVIPSSEERSSDLGTVKEHMPMNCDCGGDHGTLNEASNNEGERHELPNGISSLPELVEKENPDEQTNGEVSPIRKAESGNETDNEDSKEEPEKSRMSVLHKRVMSVETFASTEYVDPCSEFSSPVSGDLCGYPMTIPHHHHAYDGSIPSLDAPADLFHKWDRNRGKQHSMKDEENLGFSRKGLHKNKFVSSDMVDMSRSAVHRHVAYGRDNELPPRVPVHRRASRSLYENEGSSDQTGNNFIPYSSSYHLSNSSDKFIQEEDKMRLLQVIYELKGQLKKAHLNQIDGQRSQAAYYSHELSEEGPLDMNFSRHNPWARNFRSSRIPFSAETIRTAHWQDDSQRGHFPRARRQSEPLLPPAFHDERLRSTRSGNVFGPYSSQPPSPQQYMGSEFSIRSAHPSHELQKLKYYPEKENHLSRRHVRPVVSAAPFMTCCHCSETLQLPEDSFISRKRHHQVRCGACSMVLKLLLENRSCLISYEPDVRAPPPSNATTMMTPSM